MNSKKLCGQVHKDQIVSLFRSFLDENGVVITVSSDKITRDKSAYWDLFVKFQYFLLSAAASTDKISLPGLLRLCFVRSKKSKKPKMVLRFKLSDTVVSLISDLYTNTDIRETGSVESLFSRAYNMLILKRRVIENPVIFDCGSRSELLVNKE